MHNKHTQSFVSFCTAETEKYSKAIKHISGFAESQEWLCSGSSISKNTGSVARRKKFRSSNVHHRSTTARATQVNVQGKLVKAGHRSLNAGIWSAEATLPCERCCNVAGPLQGPSQSGCERFTGGKNFAGAFYDGEARISSACTRCFSAGIEVAERFRNIAHKYREK